MDGTPERQRLRGLVVDLILREGVVDLSLSAIARGVGSNNRMLLYYFGSKQALIDEAADAAFERFPRLRDMFARLRAPGDLEERLLAAWDDLADPDSRPFVRLFFQRFGVAMRDRDEWEAFTERVGREWVETVRSVLVDEGYPAARASSAAIQVIALWRGLQFLLVAGVEAEQLREAYRDSIRGMLDRNR
ncbi:TetR/AcrR family transcriptional regulator [Microbacterium sp. LRZ72]|uniref:TetR/AcrR family transcriptional regulator n=1 Tax=Microbacterium sp. LRZ72 TaxID=2942481 RepID=UPI0029BD5CDD|nr:TetR/AcrR family transcriptional regulator [Microbacterium sp. LRZ72]MDX2377690.1 TetR/AcrR family transcriptional regulator [Microbacterium sp. LRZ72]